VRWQRERQQHKHNSNGGGCEDKRMGINAKKEPDSEYIGKDNSKNVLEDMCAGDGDSEDDSDASG